MGVLNIWWVSFKYLMGVLEIFWVSWRYMIGALEIFDRFPKDIL